MTRSSSVPRDLDDVDLVQDLDHPGGWLLLSGKSEQSYVVLDDPGHLEFEYVQHFSHVIESCFLDPAPIDALHLGGGLCTVPRWIAAAWPGSRQHVIEASAHVAELCRSLELPAGIEIEIADASQWLSRPPRPRRQPLLAVVDVYAGAATVTSPLSLAGLQLLAGHVHRDAVVLANLSDAKPFELARVVAANARLIWPTVLMIAEPPILRGRRSGNFVLVASQRSLDIEDITRRCASGPARGRVLARDELSQWIGDATPISDHDAMPPSGESLLRPL